MSIPQDEWLHLARRLAVGGSTRHHHGRERRPNLIVGNKDDRYWCYCQACKTGGVVMKEHVVITGRTAPVTSCDLALPLDMERVVEASKAVQDGVLGFLASKNMDAMYLPDLYYSKSRCRVLISHHGEWLGRDTTGASPQKWITYNRSNHLGPVQCYGHDVAVVVEDPFSFFKVRWAMRGLLCSIYTSLGTTLSGELMLKLIQHHKKVVMFYDGDAAGYAGADRESQRLRSCGINSTRHCAGWGADPKDMTIEGIRAVLAQHLEVV